ncbi:MAG: VWA domain-containing protein [Acidobacteria bacterium]|nr:VWA domain-containing protein [Acidobacteriota bacterium]
MPTAARRWTRWIALLFVSAAAAAQIGNQNTGAEQVRRRPIFRVDSNMVVVDVTVRDRKGNLVGDVRKEEFLVFEDNIRQEVVTFAREEIPAGPVDEGADKAEGQPAVVNLGAVAPALRRQEDLQDKRLVILFFDLSSLSTEDLIRSVSTATEFVANKSTRHDLVAIATYDSTVEMIQDLTNDRDLLLKTLRQLNPAETGDTSAEEESEEEGSEDLFVPDVVQFNIFNTDRRLSAIESLAKVYREFPERKSLIYFSGGLATTGVENQAQVRSTVDGANRSNMSIYTVDSRGLLAEPAGGDARRGGAAGRAMFSGTAVTGRRDALADSQETLFTLAHDTGGTALQDTNDLSPVFDKVVNDTRSYYVLGYYPTNRSEDGRFRKIRVEVARADLRIQHRPGYFAAKAFSRMTEAERDRQLEEAFNVDRPFSEVPFILEADYFKDEGQTTLLPVSLQLAGDAIQFEVRGDRRLAAFEFLGRITDPRGRVAGLVRDIVQVRLPAEKAERIRGGQILYTTGFQMRPGQYGLKFLIRDNRTGKLGSFEQPLAVPLLDGKSLQTSSIVLGSRLVEAAGRTQGVELSGFGERFRELGLRRDPLVTGNKRVVPSIGNVFLGRQTAYVYFEVYGAAANPDSRKPALETRLQIVHGSRRVRESQPERIEDWMKDSRGTMQVTLAVPLQGLGKGNYVLQVHVRDLVAEANIFRRLPLVIS